MTKLIQKLVIAFAISGFVTGAAICVPAQTRNDNVLNQPLGTSQRGAQQVPGEGVENPARNEQTVTPLSDPPLTFLQRAAEQVPRDERETEATKVTSLSPHPLGGLCVWTIASPTGGNGCS